MGFADWKGTAPTSKRDREYIVNAAIKAHNENAKRRQDFIDSFTMYWFILARHMLTQ